MAERARGIATVAAGSNAPVATADQACTEVTNNIIREVCQIDNSDISFRLFGKNRATTSLMYGRVLRKLREAKGRSQADVARSVEISPAHLARLETSQRGLYLEDFVRIVEVLGEKPGNLLPNDVGDIGHLKPLIDRLAAVPAELLPRITAILEKIILLTEAASPDAKLPRKSKPAARLRVRD